MSGERSVVTGAAGFIGSHLVERLLGEGHRVVGVDAFTDYYERDRKRANLRAASAHASFELVEGDLSALDLARLLDGTDYVFHLAAQPGVRPSWGPRFAEYVRNNISVTQRLLEAARQTQPKKLVLASSSSVYGNAPELPVSESTLPRPISPYGVTKLAAEHLCLLYAETFGVPAVALRLFTVYGPRQRPDMAIQRFLSAALSGAPITVYGDGTQTRDFTFVDDVVDAHLRALANADERVFNVCGGSRISVNDLVSLIGDVTGRRLRIERSPAAPGDAKDTLGDNSRAARLLGFRPAVSLADGLGRQWRWLQETSAEQEAR